MNCATPTTIISSKKTKSQIILLLSTFFPPYSKKIFIHMPLPEAAKAAKTPDEGHKQCGTRSYARKVQFFLLVLERGRWSRCCTPGEWRGRLAEERLILSRGRGKFPREKEMNGWGN